MKNLIYKNYIQKKYLKKNKKNKLNILYKKIVYDVIKGLNNNLKNTFHVLSDRFKLNFDLKDLKQFNKYKSVAVIGMGGSILGAEAIYNFLGKKIKKKFYFFNDINNKKISHFKKKINLNKTLIIVISKSGNTIETLSNFLYLNIIKKNSKNVILVSEKNDNIIYSLSKKFNLFHIQHRSYIGGRYSVLSEAGIVPAYLMNLNINRLRKNLKKFLIGAEKVFLKDSSLKLANILLNKNIKNLVFLNYAPELEKFLYWVQQLIAESLGKKNKGFLPIISSAPKDHHSLLQLYLDGPRDKLFHIFSLKEKSDEKIITKKISNKINFLNNKYLNEIKLSQKKALIKALKKNKIPFREHIISSINEETLAELFSYFILETAIVGKLIEVNPFDQPAVEQVKIFTNKLLK